MEIKRDRYLNLLISKKQDGWNEYMLYGGLPLMLSTTRVSPRLSLFAGFALISREILAIIKLQFRFAKCFCLNCLC